ncbi:MAG: acyl-CoA dehydrogenase family protein [Dehalococcoidia bacterium]
MVDPAAERARFSDVIGRTRDAAAYFAQHATATDLADRLPTEHFAVLAETGLLGLVIPERFGGLAAGPVIVRDYLEILASACGVTAFTQMQHVLGVNQIIQADGSPLREEMLPVYARGERYCGIAFSHIRRPGPPTLRASLRDGAIVFAGEAPWFTGWGIMHDTVLAGTLSNGDFLFALLPLDWPGLTASAPLRLAAANASSTVTLHCDNLTIPARAHLRTITPEEFARSDVNPVLRYTALPLGVSVAAVRLMRDLVAARPNAAIAEAADAFEEEAAAIRREADYWEPLRDDPDYLSVAFRVRAWAIEAGMRAAHGAVMATGGTANLITHPAQRLVRESLLYSLNAQNAELKQAEMVWLTDRARQHTKQVTSPN